MSKTTTTSAPKNTDTVAPETVPTDTVTLETVEALILAAITAEGEAGAEEYVAAAKGIFSLRQQPGCPSLRALTVKGHAMFGSPSAVSRWERVGMALTLAKADDLVAPTGFTTAKAIFACIRQAENDRKVPVADVVAAITAVAEKKRGNKGTAAMVAAIDALTVAPVAPEEPETDDETDEATLTDEGTADEVLALLTAASGPVMAALAAVQGGTVVTDEARAAAQALVEALAAITA